MIRRTIDDVQSSVVTPVAPGLGLVDRLMGPIDEFLFSSLITGWRQDTWGDAISLLESARSETIRSTIESQALALSDRILTIGPN